jgi:hypothetical protein
MLRGKGKVAPGLLWGTGRYYGGEIGEEAFRADLRSHPVLYTCFIKSSRRCVCSYSGDSLSSQDGCVTVSGLTVLTCSDSWLPLSTWLATAIHCSFSR